MAVLDLNKQDTKFESNVDMKSKSFGIGDASAIIDILRNRMYSKPIQTLVQEYICNARDAMIEAGTLGKTKIKVTAPTRLATQFRVRDFGVGLSEDRVQNIFTMYGNSTKRSSNNQIGGYGLGAKSAWAYTDSFTVVSFYNGTKTTYLCHVGKDNVGSMDVLNKESTTEPNGVEVIVTVKPEHVSEFITACNRCLTFWREDTYELNVGLTPHLTKGTYDDGFCLRLNYNYYSSSNYILVDDIIFELKSNFHFNNGVSFRCKTGDVDVAPSRETIIDNDKFKAFVEKCKAHMIDLEKSYKGMSLEKKIDNYKSYSEVINISSISIDNNFEILHGSLRVNKDLVKRLTNKVGNIDYKKYDHYSTTVSFKFDMTTQVIIDDGKTNFVPSKLEHYYDSNNIKFGRHTDCIVVTSLSELPAYLHDKLTIVDATTLQPAPKLPRGTARVSNENCKIAKVDNWGFNVTESQVSRVVQSDYDFKFAYVGYKDNQKLIETLKFTKGKALLLKKEDYDASKLPTLEEYMEKLAVKERLLIGNISDRTYETIFKEFPDEDAPTFGREPYYFLLTDDEKKLHEKNRKAGESKITALKIKYPLVIYFGSYNKDASAFIEYITLKKKETTKQTKKVG